MRIDDVILKLKVIFSYLRQDLTRILLGTAMDTNVNGQLETGNKCSRKNFLLIEAGFKSLAVGAKWNSRYELHKSLFSKIRIIISHLVQGLTRIFLSTKMDTKIVL